MGVVGSARRGVPRRPEAVLLEGLLASSQQGTGTAGHDEKDFAVSGRTPRLLPRVSPMVDSGAASPKRKSFKKV